MIKRPNTIKMKRLLQHFIDCDRGDRRQLKELQEDAKRVLGIEVEKPSSGVAARPPRKQTRHR
jgi:hypothetical protein